MSGCDNSADAAALPFAVTSPGRAGPIDIIFLVTRLENLIASGKKLPLTSNIVLDQNAALGLIDELRVAIPEESRRILDRTHLEAEGIRQGADEYAASILGKLEGEVDRTLHSIRKGIAVLDSRNPPEGDEDGPVVPADGYADDEDFQPAPARSPRG